MDGAPRTFEVCYGPSTYRTHCVLPLTVFLDVEPPSYRAQCALPLTVFAELEFLCRPEADAMDSAPRTIEVCYGPQIKKRPKNRAFGMT